MTSEGKLPPGGAMTKTPELEDAKKDKTRSLRCYCVGLLVFALFAGGTTVGTLFVTGAFDIIETIPTDAPTGAPTSTPSIGPTLSPVPTPDPTSAPSLSPSVSPTPPTVTPTSSPSPQPSSSPTSSPSQQPTSSPTPLPTDAPTQLPTSSPTPLPTTAPSTSPTSAPSSQPTSSPSPLPTDAPSQLPTASPTLLPTDAPSLAALTNSELKAVMAGRLEMMVGWSDVCGVGCSNPPMKFSTFFDDTCSASGTDTNCVTIPAENRTYGQANLDGTINFDDRLYLQLDASSLSCGLATDADCATGTPAQQAVYALGFLCVSLGWRDVCSGCALPPDRLTEYCVDSSLSTTLTGSGTLPGSLVLAGAPGDDDNFYISAFVHPTAPSLPLLDYARANCHVTLGWRDVCNGCFDPPSKRGSVGFDGTCFDVVGSDSLCVGSYASVNSDGALSGDDTFYAALTCN